jgi:hypothetical protein
VLLLDHNLNRVGSGLAVDDLEKVGYTRSYLMGLFAGFDDDPICSLDDPLGYQHGQEAYAELEKEGLIYA